MLPSGHRAWRAVWDFRQIRKGGTLSLWVNAPLHHLYSLGSGEWAGLQPPWTPLALYLFTGSNLLKSTQQTLWPPCPILPLVSSHKGCLISGRWERRQLLTEGDIGEGKQKRAYWSSWMCRLTFFVKIGKCSVISSLSILSAPFSLSFPSGIPIMHMVIHLIMSHKSLRLCSVLSFFFLSVPQTI